MTQIKDNLTKDYKNHKINTKVLYAFESKTHRKENKQSSLKCLNGIPKSPKLVLIFEAHIQHKKKGAIMNNQNELS